MKGPLVQYLCVGMCQRALREGCDSVKISVPHTLDTFPFLSFSPGKTSEDAYGQWLGYYAVGAVTEALANRTAAAAAAGTYAVTLSLNRTSLFTGGPLPQLGPRPRGLEDRVWGRCLHGCHTRVVCFLLPCCALRCFPLCTKPGGALQVTDGGLQTAGYKVSVTDSLSSSSWIGCPCSQSFIPRSSLGAALLPVLVVPCPPPPFPYLLSIKSISLHTPTSFKVPSVLSLKVFKPLESFIP